MPLICTREPIPAVIAMPKAPPITTRKVGLNSGAPELFALIAPVTTNPTMAKVTILQALAPGVGANAPAKGISPPIIKLVAEATDA